jgi:hypothetical protein
LVSRYVWEDGKARDNVANHGVSFEEAETVLDSDMARWFPDVAHSGYEDRFLAIGPSVLGRFLVVVTSEGGRRPRIISAWRATKREQREYDGG